MPVLVCFFKKESEFNKKTRLWVQTNAKKLFGILPVNMAKLQLGTARNYREME
jgi:hypothetical protein